MCAQRWRINKISVEAGGTDEFLNPGRQLSLRATFNHERTCIRAITWDSRSTVRTSRCRIAALQRGSIHRRHPQAGVLARPHRYQAWSRQRHAFAVRETNCERTRETMGETNWIGRYVLGAAAWSKPLNWVVRETEDARAICKLSYLFSVPSRIMYSLFPMVPLALVTQCHGTQHRLTRLHRATRQRHTPK